MIQIKQNNDNGNNNDTPVMIMVMIMIQNQSDDNDNETLANNDYDNDKSSNDPTPAGYPLHTHGGAMWGFWSDALIYPETDLGMFLVCNGPDGSMAGTAFRKIEMFATDVLLGKQPW